MTTRDDRSQDKITKGKQAQELLSNPLFNEIFTAIKAGYFEKLINIKKGDDYARDLKDVHESMQNLRMIEAYIDRCISSEKVVMNERNKIDINA
jgi:hypothetical protein